MSTAAESLKAALDKVPQGLLVGGEWVDPGATFDVENPATGETLHQVADAGADHAVQALDAAVAAQEEWAATPPRERADILRRSFDAIHAEADAIATVMTAEMGKPLAESKGEVSYGAEFLRWFSEEAVRISGRYQVAAAGGSRVLTMKQPVGPAYAITPWNFPLAMATRKIGPALAAGCTMVLKPASATPLTSLTMGRILQEAGLPAGVLNIVTSTSSSAVSEPIISDPRLRKLTFTGSTEVGRKLIAQSAEGVLKTSMELGGNAPFVVCEDADLDKAVEGAVLAKMRNIGEACTAANRFLVHSSVADEFGKRLSERMSGLKAGNGLDEDTKLGPLIDEDAVAKVEELVADALEHGGTVLTGGNRIEGKGHFYEPTVLADVSADARIMHEEVFGPVAPITRFEDDTEAIRLANDTEFGLVAYVFTTGLNRALTYAEGLASGMVGVNQGIVSNPSAPFGGVKASGLGREGGFEGIEEYLETKNVALSL